MSEFWTDTWLFDSLLVTTALMAAILLIRRPVAKLFGAGVAYALWLIPAARLLMPSMTGDAVPVGEASQGISDAVRDSILSGIVTAEPATATVAASPSIDFAALAITIWLGGAVLFFIVQMIRYASMRDDLLSGAEQVTVIDGVRVVASDQVAGPLAFGLFARYIAVPLDFAKTFSPAEQELAIAHEMAHHKSGDLFANLAAFIVLCLMWFNPLAWMSWSAFRFDQEAACDARVLAGKCAEDRVIYGQALARTAFDGVPTFATALNSPKTIIERLRRLTMKDASAKRRSVGKLGILTAAAIVLPLTATIVPAVTAHDESTTVFKPTDKSVKIVKISIGTVVDGKPTGSVVKTVSRGGKTYIFRTDKKLSDEEVERWIEKAEKSREKADDALQQADEVRIEADAALSETDAAMIEATAARGEAYSARVAADHARAAADIGRREAFRVMQNTNFASYVPEINIREITRNCREGQPVSTNVQGFDGQNKSTIKIVMCGKGQGHIARASAIDGLRDAQQDLRSNTDVPESIRRDVISKLEKQIDRLERELGRAMPEAPKPPRAPREPQAPQAPTAWF